MTELQGLATGMVVAGFLLVIGGIMWNVMKEHTRRDEQSRRDAAHLNSRYL